MARKLSVLQQELYDLMVADDFEQYVHLDDGETLEAFMEDLAEEISGLDAIELRRNIKVWKEDISFGRRK